MTVTSVRPRNDPGQYDDLAAEWWRADGAFAALHWLAAARARLIPASTRPTAVLVDVACGGGLLAPLVSGYRHVGVDVNVSALAAAAAAGVEVVQGDATALPLPDGSADVVVAGEIFEHLGDLPGRSQLEAAVAEIGRVLRPGGVLVCDTINATRWARFSLVTLGERLPGGPPPRIHDPALFVAPRRLQRLCAREEIELEVIGLRPSLIDYVRWLLGRCGSVRMVPTRSLAGVYQATGRKAGR